MTSLCHVCQEYRTTDLNDMNIIITLIILYYTLAVGNIHRKMWKGIHLNNHGLKACTFLDFFLVVSLRSIIPHE